LQIGGVTIEWVYMGEHRGGLVDHEDVGILVEDL